MPYFAAKACKKRWSSGFLWSSWMMLWSTYWTAKSTWILSTPIRSNCKQAIVPVASCNSVWSILSPTSSPGSSEPLTMWSLRILVTRLSAIAHHPRETTSVPPYSTQPPLPLRRLRVLSRRGRAFGLTAHDPLVDHAIPLDALAELLSSLLLGALFRKPAHAGYDVGADATGLPVVIGDVRMHDGEAALGLLVALRGVGDEVALLQDLHDGPVGKLDGSARVVHEDPLDLVPPLPVAPPALLGERLYLPLDLPAALPEFPLGFLLGAPRLGGSLVLAPELLPCPLTLLLAPLRASAARNEVDREQQEQNHRHHDDYYQGRSTHVFSSHSVV